jgi:hypothetical protein
VRWDTHHRPFLTDALVQRLDHGTKDETIVLNHTLLPAGIDVPLWCF